MRGLPPTRVSSGGGGASTYPAGGRFHSFPGSSGRPACCPPTPLTSPSRSPLAPLPPSSSPLLPVTPNPPPYTCPAPRSRPALSLDPGPLGQINNRDLPPVCSVPVSLGERRGREFRVAANPRFSSLGPPSLAAGSLSAKGRAGSESRGLLCPECATLRATLPGGLVGSPGSEVGASTSR